MNTPRSLSKRLLSLYPIKAVKEHFNIKGKMEDVIEQVSTKYNSDSIRSFAFQHFNSTKQHIYIYDLESEFLVGDFKRDSFPIKIEREVETEGEYVFFMLPEVLYKIIFLDDGEKTTLKMQQPVMGRVINRTLILQFTILERNIDHYFPDRPVFRTDKSNDEEFTRYSLELFFNDNYEIFPSDLNKGVKSLWEEDLIDCKSVKFRKSWSVAAEVMNEEFTLKTKLPEVYEQLMESPLNKTLFKYLKDDGYLCDGFAVDPSNGLISISRFPKSRNQVSNVITEILNRN